MYVCQQALISVRNGSPLMVQRCSNGSRLAIWGTVGQVSVLWRGKGIILKCSDDNDDDYKDNGDSD
jgi:hypothetical protein